MRHWLIIYDIRDPKRLRKVAKMMENYGVRVQKSVFEVEAKDQIIKEMRSKVQALIEEEDFVVYFNLCERDWQKKIKYGPDKFEETDEKDYYIL